MKWQEVVGAVAPTLGKMFGGPLGGMAGTLVARVLTGKEQASDQELDQAAARLTPEQLVEIRRIDAETARHLADNGIELEKLDVERDKLSAWDRANARAREIATRDGAPLIIGLVVLGLWCWVTWYMLTTGLPTTLDEGIVGRMLGILDAGVTGTLWYFLGSSRGSDRKTAILAQETRQAER